MLFEGLLTRYMRSHFSGLMSFDSSTRRLTLPSPVTGRDYLLYVHIPFCESLCPFCSFHRVRFREARARSYFAALERELRWYANAGFRFRELYVGGGTPTVMPEELTRIIRVARELFGIGRVSVETNPNHLVEDVLGSLGDAGVDRLSVGVQSFDDEILAGMGRLAPYGDGATIRERVQAAQGRFETLNVDMIFNIPDQSRDSLERDLRTLKDELRVDQISWYPMMVPAGAAGTIRRSMGRVDYRREREFYELIGGTLEASYRASSVWCFSKTSDMIDEYLTSDHEFVGVGSGAFSYLGGAMYSSTFSLRQYPRLIEAGRPGITHCWPLSRREQMLYDLLMQLLGLRLDRRFLDSKYGGRFYSTLRWVLSSMSLLGMTTMGPDEIRLTPRGRYYWLVIMRDFFVAVDDLRDAMRREIRNADAADPGSRERLATG